MINRLNIDVYKYILKPYIGYTDMLNELFKKIRSTRGRCIEVRAMQVFETCTLALSINPNMLKCIKSKHLSREVYTRLCRLAVSKKGTAIRYCDKKYVYDYSSLANIAVNNTGKSLEYICGYHVDDYYNICIQAVKNHGWALFNVDRYLLSDYQYSKIMKAAINQNHIIDEYIRDDYMNNNQCLSEYMLDIYHYHVHGLAV